MQRQIRDAYAPLKAPPKSATEATTEPNAGTNAPAAPILPQRPPFAGPNANRAQ